MKYNFEIGQIVHHKRYGYRGVIFERDPNCTADEDWYLSNQTQPPRDQPWYHVMVHGRTHTTYVAENHLEPDEEQTPIEHPYLHRFFEAKHGDRYYRKNLN